MHHAQRRADPLDDRQRDVPASRPAAGRDLRIARLTVSIIEWIRRRPLSMSILGAVADGVRAGADRYMAFITFFDVAGFRQDGAR